MRITIIANGFQESYTIDLINGMAVASKNDEIQLIGSSKYPREKVDKKIRITDLASGTHGNAFLEKIRRNAGYYIKLVRQINRKNTDVIHTQWLNLTFLDGIVIPLYFRMCGIRIIYTAHDVLPHSRDNLLNRLLFRLIYRIPHHLAVHTQFIKNRLIKEFGIISERISVIRHGIYTVDNDERITKSEARNLLGIAESDFVILFFGIITKYKGLSILTDALGLLNKEIPNTRIVIAGKVDPRYQAEFDAILSKHDKENLKVFPGHIEEFKIQAFFKSADVTVLPYLEASQSGVMFLSYTFGIPVIAPRIGGFPNDIIQGRTGYLFKAGDAESLAKSIIRLHKEFNDPGNRDFIKKHTRENYSWEKTGHDLLRIYKN